MYVLKKHCKHTITEPPAVNLLLSKVRSLSKIQMHPYKYEPN
ncbi:hypothetical protein BVRB_6g131130 [Beta vulgaris subsp. vulgaris]|nr:hypothetical protein BVRB_6g131130 [Beta vulgaris subsp. vulgaris]